MDNFIVVDKNAWARDATSIQSLEKGAVVQRIVGDVWFHVATTDIASLRNFSRKDITWGIAKRDEDDTSIPDVAVDAFREDWLQLHMECISTAFDPTPTLAWWGGELQVHRNVDIRVKRKLNSEEQLLLFVCDIAGAGLQNASTMSALFRTLIKLP